MRLLVTFVIYMYINLIKIIKMIKLIGRATAPCAHTIVKRLSLLEACVKYGKLVALTSARIHKSKCREVF